MKTAKKSTVREYTRFTKHDWYGFAGAEPFKSGADPFIMDCGFGLIVADANGMMCTTAPNFDEAYSRDYASKNAEYEAEVVLSALTVHGPLSQETLLAFGFVTYEEKAARQ